MNTRDTHRTHETDGTGGRGAPDVPDGPDVLVVPASTRTGSLNRALAELIRARLGERAVVVDLDDHDMPMYHGDLEVSSGVPAPAVALAERLRASRAVVIVSPEYNGSFPPLLKNAIDWATRADRGVLSDATVLLAAATPGRSGGREVLAMLRMWMGHMRVDLADSDLGVARAALEDGRFVGLTDDELDGFLDQVPCLEPCG